MRVSRRGGEARKWRGFWYVQVLPPVRPKRRRRKYGAHMGAGRDMARRDVDTHRGGSPHPGDTGVGHRADTATSPGSDGWRRGVRARAPSRERARRDE